MKQTCVTLMLLCVWGCGSSLLERSITEGSAVIDNWVSEMPAQRLREKCAESQGTLFDSVTVGACAGGNGASLVTRRRHRRRRPRPALR